MKVDGLAIDVGVENVLVEEKRAARIVGHVKSFLKNNRDPQFVSLMRLPFHVWAQGSSCRC